jgi:ankyrin repeat protein
MWAKKIIVVLLLSVGTWTMASSGDTRVVDAAMKNDIETVRSLLKQAADANSSQGDGMTALHWAAMNNNPEMAQLLIYAGATVKATTRIGMYTPLYLAAQNGNAKVIDVLLKAGADAKAPTLDGVTPLMMAASSGDPDTVKSLLEFGVDVNAEETASGQTAMVFAAAFNRPDAIKILARYGANLDHQSKQIKRVQNDLTDKNGPPAQGAQAGQRGQRGQQAAPGQQPPQATPPLGQAPPVPVQGQVANALPRDPTHAGGNLKGELTPLMYAARQGNLAAVGALVDSGAKLNVVSADGSTALLLAAINGQFDVADYLVQHGADVTIASVDGATPLYAVFNIQWARKSLHPQPTTKYEKTYYLDLAKRMLDKGADPNARLKKDLWYDSFGFALDGTNTTGATPFWKCSDVADVDGMRLLAARGADTTLSNMDNISPLLVASGAGFHGNDDIITPAGRMAAVRYLVDEIHADVNAVDGRNDRPAVPDYDAAQQQAPAAATVTTSPVTAGQQPPVPPVVQQMNAGTRAGGYSALHNAAARGDNEMILFLVSRGARLDAVARNGNTITDMANGPRQRVQPRPETIALLEALGVKEQLQVHILLMEMFFCD